MPVALIIVPIIAAIVGLVIWSYTQEKKRLAELDAWARAGGWSFAPDRRKQQSVPFDLFNHGDARYSRFHAARRFEEATPGLASAALELFEYHYEETSGSGQNRSTNHYYFTCVLVDVGAELGRVRLRPEGWGDKLAQAIGFGDINFEDGEFSKRFFVTAADRKDAYDLFDGAMMRFLVTNGDVSLETQQRMLLVSKREHASPRNYDAAVAFTCGLLAQLPRPLVNEARAHAGLSPLVAAGNAAPSSLERRPH